MKKVVIFGGGNGLSTLLRGLKDYPIDITAVVSVCDDGKSTGILRQEFNTPAVGDIRRVIVSLAETEPLVGDLFNYRFNTTSDLNGHTVGNLLLTALTDMTGNLSDGIEALGKVLNLKGKVLPVTEDNVVLMGKMGDGRIVEGEHHITMDESNIVDVFYKEKPIVNQEVLKAISEADLIILSIGSIFTSIIPNLLCEEVVDAIDKAKAKVMYVCNMMTQPGETEHFSVSDHVNLLNRYLGEKKIGILIANNGKISEELLKKYETLEQKDQVYLDLANVKKMDLKLISNDFVKIEDEMIRHDVIKLAFYIYSTLLRG